MVTPLFSQATAESIKLIARRGLATALAVADPARVSLDIWRLNEISGLYEMFIEDQEFHIRVDQYREAEGGDESIRRVSLSGLIRRFLPGDDADRLKVGDRFDLPESGGASIVAVRPDRFGIESATWALESGYGG
jgi:hypothetical protein